MVMASKFKVGDKVVFVNEVGHNMLPLITPGAGTVGEIVKIDTDGFHLIQWEDGSTSEDDMHYCSEKWLKQYKPQIDKLIITRKDNEVHCVRIANGEKAHTVAKCSPNDTFDFEKGAMIALSRMMCL
jgi:hypothetical protein